MIIPFKGRSRAKQYIQSKPQKWGFKVWVSASSDGYVWRFEMYQGKVSQVRSEFGPIGDTVISLVRGLDKMNHKVILDNLFTTYRLVKHLLSQEIYVLGTIRSNRLNGAGEKLEDAKSVMQRGRGSSSVTSSSDNITIVRWADRKIVHMISSYAGLEPKDTAKRWDGKNKTYINVERPNAVAVYNKYMGGVDMCDRMVAHYPHKTKNKKFYLRIFFHFMNVALVNSWILYKQKTKNSMSFLQFKSEIANSLLENNKRTVTAGRPSISPPHPPQPLKKRARYDCDDAIRTDGVGHYPQFLPNKANCLRCRYIDCAKKTSYMCKKCNVPVCAVCMENFHKPQVGMNRVE